MFMAFCTLKWVDIFKRLNVETIWTNQLITHCPLCSIKKGRESIKMPGSRHDGNKQARHQRCTDMGPKAINRYHSITILGELVVVHNYGLPALNHLIARFLAVPELPLAYSKLSSNWEWNMTCSVLLSTLISRFVLSLECKWEFQTRYN